MLLRNTDRENFCLSHHIWGQISSCFIVIDTLSTLVQVPDARLSGQSYIFLWAFFFLSSIIFMGKNCMYHDNS